MFLVSSNQNKAAAAAGVQLPTVDTNNDRVGGICYAGMRFDNDGKIYRADINGNWQYAADWLLSGVVGDYYLARTIDQGTLTNDDGAGPTVMSTANQDYYIASAVPWFLRVTKVTFKISDDSAGSNVIVSKQYTFQAYVEGTGSPP